MKATSDEIPPHYSTVTGRYCRVEEQRPQPDNSSPSNSIFSNPNLHRLPHHILQTPQHQILIPKRAENGLPRHHHILLILNSRRSLPRCRYSTHPPHRILHLHPQATQDVHPQVKRHHHRPPRITHPNGGWRGGIRRGRCAHHVTTTQQSRPREDVPRRSCPS